MSELDAYIVCKRSGNAHLRTGSEASRENGSVSGVARKYGISASLMFQWRKQLGMGPAHRIVPVTISDTADGLADLAAMTPRPAASVPDRTAPAIEIELAAPAALPWRYDQP